MKYLIDRHSGYWLMAAIFGLSLLSGCVDRTANRNVSDSVSSSTGNPPVTLPTPPQKRAVGVGAEGSFVTHPKEKRVLALYYPWYQTPRYSGKWAHQEGIEPARKRIRSHAHYPSQGAYDSADPAVIDRHLTQAEKAGIDTLVCSWWGANDPTDAAVRQLLISAEKRPIKICVLWEQYEGTGGEAELKRNLTYLLQTFGPHTSYLKVDKRPVVFVYERVRRSADHNAWARALNAATKNFAPGVFIVGDGKAQDDLWMWDGLYSMPSADRFFWNSPDAYARNQHDQRRTILSTARQLNRISVAAVLPGYDDRKYNALANVPETTFLDRREGSMYRAQWQQAIRDNPDWILINSFNQWHTGTEIEPSVEMGDRYLTLTRDYANRFKHPAK